MTHSITVTILHPVILQESDLPGQPSKTREDHLRPIRVEGGDSSFRHTTPDFIRNDKFCFVNLRGNEAGRFAT